MDVLTDFLWGMFSQEDVPSLRRTRTLGLAATVRHYNDRAVPGLGGLYYGMPLVWSLLGIALCHNNNRLPSIKDMRPLTTTNALEALVMWLGLQRKADMRRGNGQRKLANREDVSFAALRRPGAYVTQPRRMLTVQPLFELGFVSAPGQRFNHYRLAESGAKIVDHFAKEYDALSRWIGGEAVNPQSSALRRLLPECSPCAASCRIIERQILQYGDGRGRRRSLERLGKDMASELGMATSRPMYLTDDHFADIRSGIAFIELRDAALTVLDKVEQHVRSRAGNVAAIRDGASAAADELAALKAIAIRMIERDDSSDGKQAHQFASDCLNGGEATVRKLVKRDGTVLIFQPPDSVRIGLTPAANASAVTDEQPDSSELAAFIPQLPRIANFYSLLEDLSHGA